MGNILFNEKQKDGGYLYIEEKDEQIYLHINKVLFKENYLVDKQSLNDVQIKNSNNTLEILSVNETSTTYIIQLPKYKKEIPLQIDMLREWENKLWGETSNSVRIIPLYENIVIVLDGLDQVIEEYFLQQQYLGTQIQGSVSNLNFFKFLIDLETLEKYTQQIAPSNVKEVSSFLFQNSSKNRLHFNNIRSHMHLKRVSQFINDKFEEDINNRKQYQSVVIDNTDVFNHASEKSAEEFDYIAKTFSDSKQFFVRNMDFCARKRHLQNNFVPSLKHLKQVQVLDLSGNNINEFSLTYQQNNKDDSGNGSHSPQHFQSEDQQPENQKQQEEMQEEVQEDNFVFQDLRTLCLNTNQFLTSQNIESVFYCKALSQVQELYLINNKIGQVQIDDTRFSLKNLTYLNITANKINNSSALAIFTSESLRSLKKLVLRCNDIQRIVDNPNQCTLINLEYLDLTRNKIESEYLNLIFCSPALSNLKELQLNMNRNIINFPKINKESYTLNSLKHLNLSQNTVKTEGFLQLLEFLPSTIEHLDLQQNQINLKGEHKQAIQNIFESSINHCQDSVKILLLKSNMIIDADCIFKYFKQVRVLDLSHNLISYVDQIELPHIFRLDLCYNQQISTEALFSSLHKCKYLNRLNLSNNSIQIILKHTYGQIPLTHLDLSFNKIGDISSQIFFSCQNFQNLKQLNLSFNQIIHPILANNIHNIQSLYLAQNKITDQGNIQFIYFNIQDFKFHHIPSIYKFEFIIDLDYSKQNIQELLILLLQLFQCEYKFKQLLIRNVLFNIGLEMILSQKFQHLRELDLYSNQLVNIKFIDNIHENLQSLQKITLSKNELNVLDIFKVILMFNFISDLNVDQNVCCLPDYSFDKVPSLLEKNIQVKIKHFSFKSSLVDSQIAQNLLQLLNQTVTLNLSKNQILNIQKLNIPSLEKLDLSENVLNSESSSNIFTSNIPNLKILNLSKNQIENLFQEEQANEIKLNQLQELDCSFNHVVSKSCQIIFNSSKFENLLRINFRQNKIFQPVAEFQSKIKCERLISVILQNNGIETQGGENLFSAQSESLKFLDLSFNRIKETLKLREIGLVNLESLDLSGNQLGDEGCAEFLKCYELKKLSNLNISMNKMKIVPEQFLLPSLWMLNISGNQSIGIYSKLEEYQIQNYFVKVVL